MHTLEDVRRSYKFWSHPLLYSSVVVLFSMGKANRLRARAVEKLKLKKGDLVLDMACRLRASHFFLRFHKKNNKTY